MTFRYFVIGAGSIGHRHAENLTSLGADVTHYRWRYLDMNDLLRKIHACSGQAGVIIATATNVRLPLIVQCAAAGAALYIEKPIAYRTDEVAQIFNIPKDILARSVAGFMMRYHPVILQALSYPMNNIYRASFEIGHDITQWRQNWNFAKSYAANPDGGGVLLDLCHEIDLAYLLCGNTPLSSVTCVQHPDFVDVDIATTLDFISEDGRNVRVAMDYLAPTLIRRGSIVGLQKEINYDLVQDTLTCVVQKERITEKLEQERNEMFLHLMSDFMSLAEGRKTSNQFIPRLDKVKDVCHVIAQAWEMRKFTGQLRADLT